MKIVHHLEVFILQFFIHNALASVFPCEEVKYRNMGDTFQPYFNYACVITQEGFTNWDQLSKVFLVADKSVSLADIARNSSHCLERKGTEHAWTLSAPGIRLNCEQEFTLILTLANDQPEFIIPEREPHQYTLHAAEKVLAVPQTGMWLHTLSCSGQGNLTIATGAGLGIPSDERHDLITWNCTSVPEWIFTFDVAVTLKADDSMTYSMETSSATDSVAKVSPGDNNILVMTYCKSSDLQNLIGTNHSARFQIGEFDQSLVSITGVVQLDINGVGSVAVQHLEGGPLTSYPNGLRSDVFDSDYFEVHYLPKTVLPNDVYHNDEYIYILISIYEEDSPTYPPSPVEESSYCNCAVDTLGQPSGWSYNDIWLDIVVILDTSEAMGAASLEKASALIESFLSDGVVDFLITDPGANFYTKVGVIAMAETATVLYNLNMTAADSVQGKVEITKGLAEIDVVAAFNAAVYMFNNGRQTDRANTRQVIYYMTDSAPKHSLMPLVEFKSTGVIIVNNFLQDGKTAKPGLANLASNGYFSVNSNYLQGLQSFCKANCFCSPGKHGYGGVDPAMQASGGCYRSVPVGAPFSKAKTTCANEGAILATAHSDAKGTFLQFMISQSNARANYYWLGYAKNNAGEKWQWEDNSTDSYTNWGAGEPSKAVVARCTYVYYLVTSLPWSAGNCNIAYPFVCQSAPCSVGNKNC